MGNASDEGTTQRQELTANGRIGVVIFGFGTLPAGVTAGIAQRAIAWADEEPWLEFELMLHVAPSDVGWVVRDDLTLEGSDTIAMTIEPSCQAVLTTSVRLVKTIPSVLQIAPGLYSVLDLPPTAPWLAATITSTMTR